MEMTSIVAALNGLNTAKDILSGVLGAKIGAEVREKVAEVVDRFGVAQDAMYELREELFRLQSENQSLRNRLADVDSWNKRFAQYSLAKTIGGAVVYVSNGEPVHYACPSCVNQQQIQILQDNRTMSGKYRCAGCKAEFPIEPQKRPKQINYGDSGTV